MISAGGLQTEAVASMGRAPWRSDDLCHDFSRRLAHSSRHFDGSSLLQACLEMVVVVVVVMVGRWWAMGGWRWVWSWCFCGFESSPGRLKVAFRFLHESFRSPSTGGRGPGRREEVMKLWG